MRQGLAVILELVSVHSKRLKQFEQIFKLYPVTCKKCPYSSPPAPDWVLLLSPAVVWSCLWYYSSACHSPIWEFCHTISSFAHLQQMTSAQHEPDVLPSVRWIQHLGASLRPLLWAARCGPDRAFSGICCCPHSPKGSPVLNMKGKIHNVYQWKCSLPA